MIDLFSEEVDNDYEEVFSGFDRHGNERFKNYKIKYLTLETKLIEDHDDVECYINDYYGKPKTLNQVDPKTWEATFICG
jgi:hypothetical protein